MANAMQESWKAALLAATANSALTGTGTTGFYVALIDLGVYTYNSAHDFYNDLSGVIGTDQEIASTTLTAGVIDGNDVTFTAVVGASVEALAFYRKNAGANTTWYYTMFEDTGVTGFPVTPNGGNIVVTWNASGIAKL